MRNKKPITHTRIVCQIKTLRQYEEERIEMLSMQSVFQIIEQQDSKIFGGKSTHKVRHDSKV